MKKISKNGKGGKKEGKIGSDPQEIRQVGTLHDIIVECSGFATHFPEQGVDILSLLVNNEQSMKRDAVCFLC